MTGLSVLFNMNTDEACYVYDHIKAHRQTNEDRYSSNRQMNEERYSSNRQINEDRYSSNRQTAEDPYSSNRQTNEDRYSSNRQTNEDRYSSNRQTNEDRYSSNRQMNEDRYSSNRHIGGYSPLTSPPSPGRRSASYVDYRGPGSLDRPRYTPVYSDLSPRFRHHYDRLSDYPRTDNYFSYPGLTPSQSADGASSMSKYTRSYDRNYDYPTKTYDNSRYLDRERSDTDHGTNLSQPFEFSVDYSRTSRPVDTKTHDRSPGRDDVTVRRSPARTTSLSERASARPSDHDAPIDRPPSDRPPSDRPPSDRPPSGTGRQRLNSGDSNSSHSSERSGNPEERALFHALKNRYQESAERSSTDPGARTPFSTWRRSGNFEDVTSSNVHDDGKGRIQSVAEHSEDYRHDSRHDNVHPVKGQDQGDNMSVSTKEQTEQSPDDLIYNFRKAIHRHRFSENEKAETNRLSGESSDSANVTTKEESVNEKLERLRATKARIEERKRSEHVKSASFASEFKIDSSKKDNEKVESLDEKSDSKLIEQQSSKSTKLSRQKLVSDDLKAKYIENRKDEREKTPENPQSSDSLSRKRSSRKNKHKEHMDYWSKDQEDTGDAKSKPEGTTVPTPEEMLLGSAKQTEKSSSLRKKQDTTGSPFQFCADYSSKPQDSSTSSVSVTMKHDKDIKNISDDKVSDKTQTVSDTNEGPKVDKSKKYRKYVKAKTHELGALSSDTKPEPTKVESKDDTAVNEAAVDVGELTRLERIAKYKEERKKQLASISSKFSSGELPSLFLAGSSTQDGESPLSRSKSLKTESETKSQTSDSSISRSKSLKQDRQSDITEEDDTSPVVVSKLSGLKLAEIGSGNRSKEANINTVESQNNSDNINDKLQALRKLREEHLKKSGMTVDELKSKRSSREEQEFDKSSRGSSIESFGVTRTLLADRVFESKDNQERTPSRERVRSNSREKSTELRHSFRARDSIPESESDRATDVSDADSDIHVRSKPRKFFQEKHAKDSETANRSMFEFSTVYSKKDDSVKDRRDLSKDIKTIPEISDEKSSDSGRESVDSLSRIRRKLPSIEDVLGSKTGNTDDSARMISPDRRSVSDSSENNYDLTKDNISQLSAYEIERRKIANNIQKAKSRFKTNDSELDASNFQLGTSYSSRPSDTAKHKTSSLDRKVKLNDYEQKEKSENLVAVKEIDTDRISAKGLDLAQTMPKQSEPKTPKERKYGGGGFEIGSSYATKKIEKPSEEIIQTEIIKSDVVSSTEQTPQPKQKKEARKYGGGGLDIGTAFTPKPTEVKLDKVEVKSKEIQETKHIEGDVNDTVKEPLDKPKKVRTERKYGGEGINLGTSFVPKKIEVATVKEDNTIKERHVESTVPVPKQVKEERKYGGGGMDLGTSFADKRPERSSHSAQTKRSSDEVKSVEKEQAVIPDTKISSFTMKPMQVEEQALSPEINDTSSSKPPSSPRSDRKKMAEQRYGKVSHTSQPFEFSSVYVKKDSDIVKTENIGIIESEVDKPSINKPDNNDGVRFEKSVEMDIKSVDNVPKQSLSLISTEKTSEMPKVRRSSLERQFSDVSDSSSAKGKVEKIDLKAQAVSTASGKMVEHPLSPRRHSPVRSEHPMSPRRQSPKRSESFKTITSDTKVTEVPKVIMKSNFSSEANKIDADKHERITSEKSDTTDGDKDTKSRSRVPRPAEIKVEPKLSKSGEPKEPVVTIVKENVLEQVPETSEHKFVDLSNVELKSPVKVVQLEENKTEPEVPLFLEQKVTKVSHADEKTQERGRRTERVRPGKVKAEKTVIAKVRNETILQDSTLDDILNRNVDYLSDMEPPDFSARGRGSEKKDRPQSIHENQKTKRAFKKRAAMRRSKSEDSRSHRKAVPEENIQRKTVTDELKRSFEKVKASTDRTAVLPKDVQSMVRQEKVSHKSEESSTSPTKPLSTSPTKPPSTTQTHLGDKDSGTSSTTSAGGTVAASKLISVTTNTSTVKPAIQQTGPTVPQSILKQQTGPSVPQSIIKPQTGPSVPQSIIKPQTATSVSHSVIKPQTATSVSHSVIKPQTATSVSHSVIKPQTATSVSHSVIKPQTVGSFETKSLHEKQTSEDGELPRPTASISAMLYGESQEKTTVNEDIAQEHSSHDTEQIGGTMSDSSERSERRRQLTAGESETSRITTDSDHSVSSLLSDGSRRRRKDKTSVRKSKLNESADVPSGSRKRESEESSKSSRTAGVRRTSSSRLARETREDKHKHKDEVLDVFRRHDLEVSKSWTELNHTSTDTDQQLNDKLSANPDNNHLTNTDRVSVSKSLLDNHSVLPSRFSLPSKVSTAISKLTEAREKSSRESSPILKKNTDLNSPRGIKRGTNFSSLLQKFSASDASSSEKSDTDTQSPRGRKTLLRRQEAYAVSSQSSDDVRRTPERTQSLKIKAPAPTGSDKDSSVQRSASFKSDFMKRRFSPEPEGRRRLPVTPSSEQSDQPSPELANILNKRSQIVAKQQEEGEDVERKRIHDGKVEKSNRFSSAGNDEVIADSEVLHMLQSRRKETDSSVDYSSVSETENKSQNYSSHVTSDPVPGQSIPSHSAIQSMKSTTQDRPVIQSQSSYESKAMITLSPTASKDTQHPLVSTQNKPQTTQVPKLDLSSIDTSLNVLNSVTDDQSANHDRVSQALTNVNVSSQKEVVQFIKSVESDIKPSEIQPKIDIKTETQRSDDISVDSDSKDVDSDFVKVQPSFEKDFRQQISSTVSASSSGTIDISNKSEIIRKFSTREKTPETQSTRKTGPMKVLSPMQAPSSAGLTRTESVGRTDSERPKGILKRTPSLKHTGVSVDPELAEVLMSRRTKHDEMEEEDGDGKLTVEEEIRKARETQGEKHVDPETDRSISVAERIFHMTNKIEEAKSCPITPRARSGFTTPKSILLGSGTHTPKSQLSFDDSSNKLQNFSGTQLIEKLSSLETQQTQGVSQKRQKFQQRKRNDARTRTQPVTLQEIQLADGLETVKKFRSEVLKKASIDTFEIIQKEQQITEKAEFPLHFRKEKRPRGDRHKTLPVTAAELSAIPEGQVSETMNMLKKRFESQGARDSKADSGILSGGSDGENLERDTDSWRSMSVEESLTEDDPVKLSVFAKASMFSQMQETTKPDKKSASGAKRYIDRKKRERSRTLPITEEEVKLAAEIADEENAQEELEANGAEAPMEVSENDSPDELSRQSLKDKVKLFTTIEEEKKEAAKKKGAPPPPPKRRKGKLASRFATQPVTYEEVEKAAKISPLACSLVKPPDPEILSGLSVKAQRDLIVAHAQQTLSQPNSRAGSRAGSRATSISDLTEDLQTAFNTGVNENNSSVDTESTLSSVRPSTFKGKTFSSSQSFEETHKSQTIEKFTSDLDTKKKSVLKSELEAKLNLQLHHDKKGILKPNVNVVPTISDIKNVLKKDSSLEKTSSSSSSSSSEVKSILKKEGSFESRKLESGDIYSHKSESFKSETMSSEVAESEELEQSDDLLESSGDNLDSDEGLLDSNVPSEEHIDTPVKRRENKARRRFNRDRKKETERYKTQPTEGTPDASDISRQKKKYVGRHITQPVTPDEKLEAQIAIEMPEVTKSGSLQDRLNALKKNGEEEWKKRVARPLDLQGSDRSSTSPEMSTPNVKMRDRKQFDTPRPHSIADRLSALDSAQANWRDRVGETDVKKFTVEHKISASGQSIGESPLVARLKGRTPRREPSRDSESSDTSDLPSPLTPTKESNKIALPREVICTEIPVELLQEDSKATLSTIKSMEEEKAPSNIEVPNIDAELDSFFKTKQSLPAKTPELDVSVDDFNDLFLNASDMLETARKAKPKRRHAAKSRNPLKTMSASLDVRTEYTEVITGVADRELKRVKTAQISQNSGFAVEALAGLASKENFSKVELRKTESFGSPGGVYRLEPYLPLMLIHVKGRRKVQCRLVDPKAESINSGDCFALITADKIIQWHGEFCNVIEKAKAADFCEFVKQKRDLGCKKAHDVMIVEEKQRSPGTRYFWELLGGQKPYMAGGSAEEDELYENHITETNMIYKLEQNKLVAVDEYWGNQPKYEMLSPYQVFVFDFGSEVYLWQGKSVSPAQRKISVKLAQQVWDRGYDYSQCDINPVSPLRGEEDGGLPGKNDKRPDWALFGKVNQNMETILFREKFADWPDTSRLIMVKSQDEVNTNKVDLSDLKAYDAKLLVPVDTSPVSLVLEGSNLGRGNKWAQDMDGFIQEQVIETLKIRIWHVLEYEHYEVEDHSFGQFHEGDTYVIRWQYMVLNAGMKNLKGQLSRNSTRGRERCAYFFWQGKSSTVNEKGASALMTVELDEERGPQVRVSEGKETPCFLNLFKGRMIIHIGKREEEETNTEGPWKMYCLRNEFDNEMCLIEVNLDISNLRSVSSCLLLNVNSGSLIVWHGCKSPEHTQTLAIKAAENLKERCPLEVGLGKGVKIDISEMKEGKETAQLWRLMDVHVGDRSQYHSLLNNPESFNHTLRLFDMTSVSGVFEVHEILNPSRTRDLPTKFPVLQTDLYKASQPALMLVDNGHEVYLWQGWWPEGDEDQENVHTGSAQTRFTVDRRCAMETTLQYCKEINPDNPPPAFMVYAGLEPPSFTNLFPFWMEEEAVKDINIRLALDAESTISVREQDGKIEGELVSVEDMLRRLTKTRYTFAELTDNVRPEGVDLMKLETYLSDEEFEEVLHMTREAYDNLPNWKKTKYKQEAGLF